MQIPILNRVASKQYSDDAVGLPAGAGWGCGLAIGLRPVHRPLAKVGSWYPLGEAAAWCVKGASRQGLSPLHSMTRPDERCRVSAPHR